MIHLDEIMMRKARLAERIAGQRARLADDAAALGPLISLADRGMAAVRAIRAHPEWVAVAAGILFVLRPRRAFVWVRRGFMAWRTWTWAKTALAGAVRLM